MRFRRRLSALYDELKKAESEYKRTLLTTIKSAAESRAQFWTAAAWLLERKYPMEYGKMERKADDADNYDHAKGNSFDIGCGE